MAALASLAVTSPVQADARGACVEVSAASAPTRAPLALDAERAAWLSGQRSHGLRAAARGLVDWGGRSANPAWCEASDGPQCERGEPAPTQRDGAPSAGSGACLASAGAPPRRPPVVLTAKLPLATEEGAVGVRAELERPPRHA